MGSETMVAQPYREIGEATHNVDTDCTLREFGKSVVALRNVLYQDSPLNEAEFLFMENHLQTLEMAHLWWKRKHRL